MVHLAHTFWARIPQHLWPDNGPPVLTAEERAALLQPMFGASSAVGGLSAATLWGIPIPTGMRWTHHFLGEPAPPALVDLRPQLSFTGYRRSQARPDVLIRKGLELPVEAAVWGAQVTGALETLLAIQPLAPGWKAVAAVDHILATGLSYADPRWPITPGELLNLVDQLPPYTRGAAALRVSIGRAATNVWSPMETLLRLMLVHEQFPEPTCNLRVQLPDGTWAHLDMAWEREKVAVEYNGSIHFQNRQQYGDEMHRLAQFKRMGWDVHISICADLADRRRWQALTGDLWKALGRN